MFDIQDFARQLVVCVIAMMLVALNLNTGSSAKTDSLPAVSSIALPETQGCSDLFCNYALSFLQNQWTSFRKEKKYINKDEKQDGHAAYVPSLKEATTRLTTKKFITNIKSGFRDTVFKKVNVLQTDDEPVRDQSEENESLGLLSQGISASLPARRISGPFPPPLPIEAPDPPAMPPLCSNSPRRDADDRKDPDLPTIPPEVCGLCPPAFYLDPCTCQSLGSDLTGYMAITCPSEVSSQQHLKDILRNTEFITTDVWRFIHNDSLINGAVTRDLWEPLRIVQLINNYDHYNFVDNHAFCPHGDSLNYISFYNNSIGYFHWESIKLEEVPQLESLILAHNHLSMIPEDSMHHSGLQVLDLSYNNINYIGKDAFAGLTSLDILDLGNNALASLEDFTLHMPDRVSYNTLQLDLSYNSISYISDYAMNEMRNCQVDLRGNQLQTLAQRVFEPIIIDSGFFANFIVDGNPLHCDCSIKWFLPYKRTFDDAHCTNINKTLHRLTIEDFGGCKV